MALELNATSLIPRDVAELRLRQFKGTGLLDDYRAGLVDGIKRQFATIHGFALECLSTSPDLTSVVTLDLSLDEVGRLLVHGNEIADYSSSLVNAVIVAAVKSLPAKRMNVGSYETLKSELKVSRPVLNRFVKRFHLIPCGIEKRRGTAAHMFDRPSFLEAWDIHKREKQTKVNWRDTNRD